MTPRQLDLAYDFCEKVSADDLLDYLGLATDASTDEARAALKAKRRKMQGMQSNPKFRDEARLLIKHFQSLDAVLAEPVTHVRDMARRRESSHLPILEMTIRGVLAGGPLASEQEAYLRANATELGVSTKSFDALLRRLQLEIHGEGSETPRTGPSRGSGVGEISHDGPGLAASEEAGLDFDVGNLDDIDLGGATAGTAPSRTDAPRRPLSQRTGTPISRAGRRPDDRASARSKRRDPIGRAASLVATPKPVSRREDGSDLPSVTSAATAPPVRMRSIVPPEEDDPSTAKRGRPRSDEAMPGGMEIVGDLRRAVEVVGRSSTQLTIRVRLLGELPVAARVVTDDPWLSATPDRLSPTRREHMITVTVHPDKMYSDDDQSIVRLFNDLGEQVEVEIHARRSVNWSGLFVGIAAVVGIVVIGLTAWWAFSWLTPNDAAFLQVVVDPTAEAILLDGDKIGSGEVARLDRPRAGTHKLTVVQRNFKTYESEVSLSRDEGRTVEITLELASKLDYKPSPNATRGTVADPRMLDDVRARMEKCTARTPRNQPPYKLAVTALFKSDGSTGSVRMASDDAVPNDVAICLRRVAAAASVSVLDGDWTDVTMDVSYP